MKTRIHKLRYELYNGIWHTYPAEPWAGADLVISKEPIDLPGKVVVVTDHAAELSSLVLELRDRLKGEIDFISKYEFYPRLGMAANHCLDTVGDDLKALCFAVLDEAAMVFE